MDIMIYYIFQTNNQHKYMINLIRSVGKAVFWEVILYKTLPWVAIAYMFALRYVFNINDSDAWIGWGFFILVGIGIVGLSTGKRGLQANKQKYYGEYDTSRKDMSYFYKQHNDELSNSQQLACVITSVLMATVGSITQTYHWSIQIGLGLVVIVLILIIYNQKSNVSALRELMIYDDMRSVYWDEVIAHGQWDTKNTNTSELPSLRVLSSPNTNFLNGVGEWVGFLFIPVMIIVSIIIWV